MISKGHILTDLVEKKRKTKENIHTRQSTVTLSVVVAVVVVVDCVWVGQ